LAGPYSENFAIGSIFYSFTCGNYPYAPEAYDVPTLIHSIEDGIISVCWHGGYATVAGLEQVFGDMMDGTEWYLFPADADEWVAQHQDEYAT